MRMNDLVALYESTRRRSTEMRTWRLRLAARRARRALRRDRANEAHQVRLVAIEHELRTRGVLARPTFPPRPPGPGNGAARRRWFRRR
jgi:hypothetical protein